MQEEQSQEYLLLHPTGNINSFRPAPTLGPFGSMGRFIEHRPKNFYIDIVAEVCPYSSKYDKSENLCGVTSNII
jgi:N6-adenosine-specific RNA methylase IME4